MPGLPAACLLALASIAATARGASFQLSKLDASIPPAQGGRCMDGTMAGYYVREGTDGGETFAIFLQGGGGCNDQVKCTARSHGELGSSKNLKPNQTPKPVNGGQAPMLQDDCAANPDFCNATAVYVPYCSSDGWSGNRTTADATSWGFYFSGHANLMRVVDALVENHGLGGPANKRVLLTGQSAGAIGAWKNVDFLQQRLGARVAVKASPNAGWFDPAALPADLPFPRPPSDYPHFANGTHGNAFDPAAAEFVYDKLYQSKGVLSQACVAAQPDGAWYACGLAHYGYKYIAAPLFVVENMFDSYQIYTAMQAPQHPSADELPTVEAYVAMYGEAMRNSTQQVLDDAPIAKKAQKDGLFLPSCLSHIVPAPETIGQHSWLVVLGDWFFERGAMTDAYRLVEKCPSEQPCSPYRGCHRLSPSPPSPSPGPAPGPSPSPGPAPGPSPGPGDACEAALRQYACLPGTTPYKCKSCARAHAVQMLRAKCTTSEIHSLCGGR